jgi:hypothetical protein
MRFSLDVLPARKGDCLILHYGTAKAPHLIMIDGGPSGVYGPHLRPRLEQLKTARGLASGSPLPVDVLMVSHVDDDHIQGVLELTSELREQKTNREKPLLSVASLWHNTFDDVLSTTPKELDAAAGFGSAALDGTIDLGDADLDVAKVLASIPQGRVLRDDRAFLAAGSQSWKLNQPFKGKLIVASKPTGKVALEGGLTMRVVGPLQSEVVALQEEHDRWLRARRAKKARSAESSLAAFVDESVANLSSLVLLVAAGGKRMLLTGDARGDKIIEGLQFIGQLQPGDTSTMHVDVMKVPHHGSANNVATSFFERITADHYVFSGNGEYGNPERATLDMLFKARGTAPFVLHFTYPLDEMDRARKTDWAKQQVEERKRGRKPRPNWSAPKHALASFFAARTLSRGQKIVVSAPNRPHVIDLLDPLGV